MQSNFQRKAIFLALFFFGVSLAVFLLLYRQVDSNNKTYESSTLEWEKETSRREELKVLDNSVKLIEQEKTELETHFVKNSNVVPFLDLVEGLGSIVGAKAEIESVNIEDKTLMIEVQASGSFASIYKFISLLENSPYLLSFASVEIRKENAGAPEAETASRWNAELKIELLSFIPDKEEKDKKYI